jgi:putative hydrolase of the HAD superfamily
MQTLLMPFAKEILDHCKPHYQLHLITNGFENTQWQKLRNSGIDHYFTHVITSEKSNSLKPNKEIFEYAMQITGAKEDECLMLGDALDIDILGAANVGWHQVFYNPKKETHPKKPTYEISCWSEMLEKL